jgi:hypothetical protein
MKWEGRIRITVNSCSQAEHHGRSFQSVSSRNVSLVCCLALILVIFIRIRTARRLWWLRQSRDLPTQSFRDAHRDRVCVRSFIGVRVRVLWASVSLLCNSQKKRNHGAKSSVIHNRVVACSFVRWVVRGLHRARLVTCGICLDPSYY